MASSGDFRGIPRRARTFYALDFVSSSITKSTAHTFAPVVYHTTNLPWPFSINANNRIVISGVQGIEMPDSLAVKLGFDMIQSEMQYDSNLTHYGKWTPHPSHGGAFRRAIRKANYVGTNQRLYDIDSTIYAPTATFNSSNTYITGHTANKDMVGDNAVHFLDITNQPAVIAPVYRVVCGSSFDKTFGPADPLFIDNTTDFTTFIGQTATLYIDGVQQTGTPDFQDVFRDLDLSFSSFFNTTLANMNFQRCDMSYVQFAQTDLSGADFRGAIFNDVYPFHVPRNHLGKRIFNDLTRDPGKWVGSGVDRGVFATGVHGLDNTSLTWDGYHNNGDFLPWVFGNSQDWSLTRTYLDSYHLLDVDPFFERATQRLQNTKIDDTAHNRKLFSSVVPLYSYLDIPNDTARYRFQTATRIYDTDAPTYNGYTDVFPAKTSQHDQIDWVSVADTITINFSGAITYDNRHLWLDPLLDSRGIGAHSLQLGKSVKYRRMDQGSIYDNPVLTTVATDITSYMKTQYPGLQHVVIGSGVTSIGSRAFEECRYLESITIPSTVGSIGNDAFRKCKSLTSVTIPDGVASIPQRAFYQCSSLVSVVIPDSVTIIEKCAFLNCYELTSVTIPDSVTTIRNAAFERCYNLQSVTFGNGIQSIGDSDSGDRNDWDPRGVFRDCNSLTSIAVPSGVVSIADGTFQGCEFLASVDLPSSVTRIGESAFKDCRELTSIDLSGITSIGDEAFLLCGPLQTTDLSSVTSMGFKPFWKSSIKAITLHGGFTEFDFSECGLTSVDIPNGITSLPDGCFSGCTALHAVTMANSVTSIGEEAFSGCSALTSVDLSQSLTVIGVRAFQQCALTSIVIPSSVMEIEAYAFSTCSLLDSLVFASTDPWVEGTGLIIGIYAFYACYKLRVIDFPDSIQHIKPYAFYFTYLSTFYQNWDNPVGNKRYVRFGRNTNLWSNAFRGQLPLILGDITIHGTYNSSRGYYNDVTKPTITLTGNTVIVYVNDSYDEPGVSAKDDKDGNITHRITTTSTVNTSQIGDHTISYNVTDAAGNIADTVYRTVTVVPPPANDSANFSLSLLGQSPYLPYDFSIGSKINYTFLHAAHVDWGVTVNDNRYQVNAPPIVISIDDTVDTSTVGMYPTVYTASDGAGNTSTATRWTQVRASMEYMVKIDGPDSKVMTFKWSINTAFPGYFAYASTEDGGIARYPNPKETMLSNDRPTKGLYDVSALIDPGRPCRLWAHDGTRNDWATTDLSTEESEVSDTFRPGKDIFAGLDLSMSYSVGVPIEDYTSPDFYGATMTGMNFSGCNMIGATFLESTFIDADLTDCNLTGADFSGANIAGCDFTGATLVDVVGLNTLPNNSIVGAVFDATLRNKALFTAAQQALLFSSAAAPSVLRQDKLEATLVVVDGRASKTDAKTVAARTALKDDIQAASPGQKKVKRRAAIRAMFRNNAGLKKIPVTREELGLSQKLKHANVVVFKPNEIIDIAAVNGADESFYCALENNEQVTLSKEGKQFVVRRQDSGGVERYRIITSSALTFTKGGAPYTPGPFDLKEDDVFSTTFDTETHDFFIGSVGDGSGDGSSGGSSGGASGDPFLVTLL